MAEPFIFITNHTIKPGRLDDLLERNDQFIAFVRANEPRILGLHVYLSEDQTQLALVQVHPDAESMEHHLSVAGDQIHQALDVVENQSIQVYGSPASSARRLLEQIQTAGVGVNVMPHQLRGIAPAALT
jgi:hypothetical protein